MFKREEKTYGFKSLLLYFVKLISRNLKKALIYFFLVKSISRDFINVFLTLFFLQYQFHESKEKYIFYLTGACGLSNFTLVTYVATKFDDIKHEVWNWYWILPASTAIICGTQKYWAENILFLLEPKIMIVMILSKHTILYFIMSYFFLIKNYSFGCTSYFLIGK